MTTTLTVRSNPHAVIAALSMLLCATGCDLGRALVDRGIDHGAGGLTCKPPLPCDAPIPDFQLDGGVASGATPVSFDGCDGGPDQPPGVLEEDAELDCKNLRVALGANSSDEVVR